MWIKETRASFYFGGSNKVGEVLRHRRRRKAVRSFDACKEQRSCSVWWRSTTELTERQESARSVENGELLKRWRWLTWIALTRETKAQLVVCCCFVASAGMNG